MNKRIKIDIFYFSESGNSSMELPLNSFVLNENSGRDSIDEEIADKLESALEESLDLICEYYDDFLQEIEKVLFLKYRFLLLRNKRTWLFSEVFTRNIESSFSRVRMIAYLDFLIKIRSWIDYEISTDCFLLSSLLIENDIPVKYIGEKSNESSMLLKVVALNFILAKHFKKNVSTKQIAVLSLSSNWTREKGDRHLGDLKSIDQDFSYLHFITSRSHISKFNSEDIVLNSFLTIGDFFKVFFVSIYFYLRILFGEKVSVKYKDMKLSSWLKQSLLEMCLKDFPPGFFYVNSVRNYFKRTHAMKPIMVTYGELFPLNQYMYSSLRELIGVPLVIAIQHAVNFKRKIVNHNKFVYKPSEFPDYYLVHGPKYERELSKACLPLKSEIIGCLKYDKIHFGDQVCSLGKKNCVLIVPSLNDFDSIYESLENIDTQFASKFEFILSAHPASNSAHIKKKLDELPFEVSVAQNVSSLELAKTCDVVIFSYSSVGFEALFFNKKIIRVYSRKLPKLFDDDYRVPTVYNSIQLMTALTEAKNSKAEEIINDYFGFSDGRVYKRFSKIISQITRENSNVASR